MKLTMLIFLFLLLLSCTDKKELDRLQKLNTELKAKYQKQQGSLEKALEAGQKFDFLVRKMQGVKATIETSLGNIELEFFPEKAPLTSYSFITRAEAGFYTGTKFHRVMPGFMIQGGDPNTKDDTVSDDGKGGPLVAQPHEFNELSHKRGVLSTARPPSLSLGAGSQFFIMHADNPRLDRQYTVFGKVTSGMDVVDKIAARKNRNYPPNYPVEPVIINRVIVKR